MKFSASSFQLPVPNWFPLPEKNHDVSPLEF
jgi:hypothetical protein